MLLPDKEGNRTFIDQLIFPGRIHPTLIIKHKAQRIQSLTDRQMPQCKSFRLDLFSGCSTQRLCQTMRIKQFFSSFLIRIYRYIQAAVRRIPHIPELMRTLYPLRIDIGIENFIRTELLFQCISTPIIISRTLSDSHAPTKEHGYQPT